MSDQFKILFSVLGIAIFFAIFLNLNTGFLDLHLADFFSETAHSQIAEIRINRVLVMILAGISIPTSGFLMQEYFQNPLAGPDILGITSVASLSVAFYIFFSQNLIIPEIFQNSFMSLSAIGGSLLLMTLLLSPRARRNALIFLMAIFTLGNVLSAISPDYTTMMLSRILTSLNHGAFFGLGSVVAAIGRAHV